MEIDSIDCSQFRDFYSVVRQLIDNGFLQNDFSVLQSQFYRIRNSYINNDFKHPEIKEIDVSVGSLAGGLMANGMTQEDVDMIRRIEKDLRVPSSCCVPYFICSLDPEYKRLVGMSNSMDRVQITEKLYYLEYYYMFLSLNLLITSYQELKNENPNSLLQSNSIKKEFITFCEEELNSSFIAHLLHYLDEFLQILRTHPKFSPSHGSTVPTNTPTNPMPSVGFNSTMAPSVVHQNLTFAQQPIEFITNDRSRPPSAAHSKNSFANSSLLFEDYSHDYLLRNLKMISILLYSLCNCCSLEQQFKSFLNCIQTYLTLTNQSIFASDYENDLLLNYMYYIILGGVQNLLLYSSFYYHQDDLEANEQTYNHLLEAIENSTLDEKYKLFFKVVFSSAVMYMEVLLEHPTQPPTELFKSSLKSKPLTTLYTMISSIEFYSLVKRNLLAQTIFVFLKQFIKATSSINYELPTHKQLLNASSSLSETQHFSIVNTTIQTETNTIEDLLYLFNYLFIHFPSLLSTFYLENDDQTGFIHSFNNNISSLLMDHYELFPHFIRFLSIIARTSSQNSYVIYDYIQNNPSEAVLWNRFSEAINQLKHYADQGLRLQSNQNAAQPRLSVESDEIWNISSVINLFAAVISNTTAYEKFFNSTDNPYSPQADPVALCLNLLFYPFPCIIKSSIFNLLTKALKYDLYAKKIWSILCTAHVLPPRQECPSSSSPLAYHQFTVPCQGLKHEFVEEEKKQNSFPCTCQFLIFFNTLIRQPVNDSILDDPEFAVYLSFIINDIFLSSFDISILQCREGEKYKIQSLCLEILTFVIQRFLSRLHSKQTWKDSPTLYLLKELLRQSSLLESIFTILTTPRVTIHKNYVILPSSTPYDNDLTNALFDSELQNVNYWFDMILLSVLHLLESLLSVTSETIQQLSEMFPLTTMYSLLLHSKNQEILTTLFSLIQYPHCQIQLYSIKIYIGLLKANSTQELLLYFHHHPNLLRTLKSSYYHQFELLSERKTHYCPEDLTFFQDWSFFHEREQENSLYLEEICNSILSLLLFDIKKEAQSNSYLLLDLPAVFQALEQEVSQGQAQLEHCSLLNLFIVMSMTERYQVDFPDLTYKCAEILYSLLSSTHSSFVQCFAHYLYSKQFFLTILTFFEYDVFNPATMTLPSYSFHKDEQVDELEHHFMNSNLIHLFKYYIFLLKIAQISIQSLSTQLSLLELRQHVHSYLFQRVESDGEYGLMHGFQCLFYSYSELSEPPQLLKYLSKEVWVRNSLFQEDYNQLDIERVYHSFLVQQPSLSAEQVNQCIRWAIDMNLYNERGACLKCYLQSLCDYYSILFHYIHSHAEKVNLFTFQTLTSTTDLFYSILHSLFYQLQQTPRVSIISPLIRLCVELFSYCSSLLITEVSSLQFLMESTCDLWTHSALAYDPTYEGSQAREFMMLFLLKLMLFVNHHLEELESDWSSLSLWMGRIVPSLVDQLQSLSPSPLPLYLLAQFFYFPLPEEIKVQWIELICQGPSLNGFIQFLTQIHVSSFTEDKDSFQTFEFVEAIFKLFSSFCSTPKGALKLNELNLLQQLWVPLKEFQQPYAVGTLRTSFLSTNQRNFLFHFYSFLFSLAFKLFITLYPDVDMTESLYRLLTSSSSLISFLASDHLCDEQLKLSVFNEYLVLLNIVLCNQQLEWTDFEPFNQQLISLVSDYLVHIVNNFTLSTMIKRDLKTICQGSQVSLEEYLEYLRTTPFLTSTSPNGLYTRFVIHSVMYLMLNKYTIGTLLGEKLGFI